MHLQGETDPIAARIGGDRIYTALQRLDPCPRVRTLRRGTTIVHQDDPATHSMLLLDGWVALSKMLADGEFQIIDIMLPGDFALIGAKHAPVAACSVEALSDVRFVEIGATAANGGAERMDELREFLAAEIVVTQARTSELLLRLGKGAAATRVAYALLEFYVRLDAIGLVRDGACFDFPLTQQQLGDFVGLSSVHVCRTLRRFERAGIVSHPAKAVLRLDDIDALCGIAEVDLDELRNTILVRRDRNINEVRQPLPVSGQRVPR